MTLHLEIGGVVRTVQVRGRGSALSVLVDGQELEVDAAELEPGRWSLLLDTARGSVDVRVRPDRPGVWTVFFDGVSVPVQLHDPRSARASAGGASGGGAAGTPARITAPMPGKVVRVLVAAGETVAARQPLAVVEAMKMENELRSPRAGTVLEVNAREGASVDTGAVLLTIA